MDMEIKEDKLKKIIDELHKSIILAWSVYIDLNRELEKQKSPTKRA